GMAIMSVREGLDFDADITSDTQPLHRVVEAAFRVAPGPDSIRVLRDPTRGGLASSLCEIAASSGVSIEIEQDAIPIPPAVGAACEMLGLDPLHVANEGCCVAIVAPEAVDDVLAAWRARPEACEAVVIGEVRGEEPGRVFMRTTLGSRRIIDMLIGEQLPRIC
ncbi:MAG: AIR synthase-related protein, partial [Candidatus Nanopelagicales bacterium]|nr:AIR synthase-related protein [Candidatus Nanopelagicales bacterium]